MALTERQLKLRRNHLGASDAPAIILDREGRPLSPFQNPADIYWQKVGNLEPGEATQAMETGNRMEAPLISFAEDQLKVRATRSNLYRVSRGSDNGILSATLDARILGRPNEAIECKYVGPTFLDQWGEPETDEVPDHVKVQVQHQMYVCELDRVWVAAALAGYQLNWSIYKVERDEELIRKLVNIELAFWNQHVIPRVPPERFQPALDLIERVRKVPNKVASIPEELGTRYMDADAAKKAAEADYKAVKVEVLTAMGDAEAAVAGEIAFTHFEESRKGYYVEPTTYRALRPAKKRKVVAA